MRQIPAFHVNPEPLRRCICCKEIDVVNCFNRCPDCELRYQKDVLLETVVTAQASKLDSSSMQLMMREFELRADELLARSRT